MGFEDNMPLDTSELIEVEVSLADATYDGLEMAGTDAALVTPLNAEDAEALEQGIASMFEAMRGEIEVANEAYFDDAEDSDDDLEPMAALLAELDRIYRVLSVIGLGVALLVSSYLYQRLKVTEHPAG